jgi:hypothetical protein
MSTRLYAIHIAEFVSSRLYAIYIAADEIFKVRVVSALRDLYRRR